MGPTISQPPPHQLTIAGHTALRIWGLSPTLGPEPSGQGIFNSFQTSYLMRLHINHALQSGTWVSQCKPSGVQTLTQCSPLSRLDSLLGFLLSQRSLQETNNKLQPRSEALLFHLLSRVIAAVLCSDPSMGPPYYHVTYVLLCTCVLPIHSLNSLELFFLVWKSWSDSQWNYTLYQDWQPDGMNQCE